MLYSLVYCNAVNRQQMLIAFKPQALPLSPQIPAPVTCYRLASHPRLVSGGLDS